MDLCLTIATYRSVEALRCTLESVVRQTSIPEEILVLEDGCEAETAAVVGSFQTRLQGLKHVTQEDRGFRLARLRNLGIYHSTAPYLVCIDGDLILERHFIADHRDAAMEGYFIQGTRQKLSADLSQRLLCERRPPQGPERLLGREPGNKSRWWGLRNRMLSRHLSRSYASPRKISGCHQAFFRADLLAVNGYDNRFEGWGEEDQDLVSRLFRTGLREKHLRHGAVCWHLYHPARKRRNFPGLSGGEAFCSNGLVELVSELEGGEPPSGSRSHAS